MLIDGEAMRLLVCGGRYFHGRDQFNACMAMLPRPPSIIIEGGAKGADRLGREWAIANGVHYATVPALWDSYSNKAGTLRNTAMLLLLPEYCLAMPGGSGTANMTRQCAAAGIPVWDPFVIDGGGT